MQAHPGQKNPETLSYADKTPRFEAGVRKPQGRNRVRRRHWLVPPSPLPCALGHSLVSQSISPPHSLPWCPELATEVSRLGYHFRSPFQGAEEGEDRNQLLFLSERAEPFELVT